MAKGKKSIVFGSIVSLIMGLGSIAMITWILSQDPGTYTFYGVDATKLATDALWTLVLIYTVAGVQVIAGILGLIFAGNVKKAGFLQFVGLVLILVQAFNITHGHGTMNVTSIATNSILLIGPAFYLYGAMLNKKSN